MGPLGFWPGPCARLLQGRGRRGDLQGSPPRDKAPSVPPSHLHPPQLHRPPGTGGGVLLLEEGAEKELEATARRPSLNQLLVLPVPWGWYTAPLPRDRRHSQPRCLISPSPIRAHTRPPGLQELPGSQRCRHSWAQMWVQGWCCPDVLPPRGGAAPVSGAQDEGGTEPGGRRLHAQLPHSPWLRTPPQSPQFPDLGPAQPLNPSLPQQLPEPPAAHQDSCSPCFHPESPSHSPQLHPRPPTPSASPQHPSPVPRVTLTA